MEIASSTGNRSELVTAEFRLRSFVKQVTSVLISSTVLSTYVDLLDFSMVQHNFGGNRRRKILSSKSIKCNGHEFLS